MKRNSQAKPAGRPIESVEDFKARLRAIIGPAPAADRPGRLLVRGPGDHGYKPTATSPEPEQ